MSDEEKMTKSGKRLSPMLDEFDRIVAHALRDDPEMRDWRTQSYRYDPEYDSIRPSIDSVPEGRAVHPDGAIYWTPDRRLTAELAARTIEIRSMRYEGGPVRPMPADWKEQLRSRYPGMFECEMSVGPGWADLILAYVEMRGERGEVPIFAQIKEKYGSLRLYESGMHSDLEMIADHLSRSICEECGAPGRTRNSGWVRTLCDEHDEDQQ
jgi:hypothetical protein